MRIIPAIDIINGQCVRLTQGDYQKQKIYGNPLDMALQFEDAGIKYLHIVDLDGAKSRKVIHHQLLQEIATKTSLLIDFSGGISSEENLELAFDCGANQVTLGSIAVQDFEKTTSWLKKYGSDKIIIGADVLHELIQIHGWTASGKISLFHFIEQYVQAGATYFMCTDISKDGTMQGVAIALYQKIKLQFPTVHLIASGGVATLQDIIECAALPCDGVIVGRALYEHKISLADLVNFQN